MSSGFPNQQEHSVRSWISRLVEGVEPLLRRLARWGRQRELGQRLWRFSLRNQYRWDSPNGVASSWLERSVNYGLMSPERRASSVAALVELFFSLVDDLAIDRFVEAGAKEAGASQRAATLRPGSDVVAFEANPFTYRRFEKRLAATPVEYIHLALSDAPGMVTFQVRLTPDGAPIADGQGSLHVRSTYEPGYHETQVEAVTLDGFFADRDGGTVGPSRSAWWVDVEGASAHVLRGGRQLLQATDLVMIEVEEIRAWDQQEWLQADVVGFMADNGLVPIARDIQSRIQFNIVFVREELARSSVVARRLAAWRSAC